MNKRGRKKKENYFGAEVEQAVRDYIGASNSDEKNKIFREKLDGVIDRMILGLMTRYKLFPLIMSQEEFLHECKVHLTKQMDKFDINSDKKAYSYYGTIVKNYMLYLRKNEDKARKINLNYEDYKASIYRDEKFICENDFDFIVHTSADLKKARAKLKQLKTFLTLEMEMPYYTDKWLDAEGISVGIGIIAVCDSCDIFEDINGIRKEKNAFFEEVAQHSGIDLANTKKICKRLFADFSKYIVES